MLYTGSNGRNRGREVVMRTSRGYSSATLFYEIAKERICPALEDGQDIVVLHLGDHDPSGLDMTRDLRDRLSLYSRRGVDVRRVALNMDQVEAFNSITALDLL